MNLIFINAIVVAVITIVVGVYPYVVRRNEITRLFAQSNLWWAVWNVADLIVLLPCSHAAKVYLYRLASLSSVLVVWYFFNFILAFAQVGHSRLAAMRMAIRLVGCFLAAMMLTPLIIADIKETSYPFEVPGALFPLLIVFMIGTCGFALFHLYERIKTAKGRDQIQAKYMMLALFFAFIEGPLFFFDVYTNSIASFFYYCQVAYSLIVAYSILALRLMDISIIIRKTLLYSLVSAGLASVYAGIIMILAQVWGGPQGPSLSLSSVLAAIFITLLFNPLRMRTQRWVDQYFPRERLDPGLLQEAAGGFAHEMKRPLSKISLPAELLLMKLKEVKAGRVPWESYLPELEERLKFIIGQSVSAGTMIEAIRELSSSKAHPLEGTSLQAVIRQALLGEKDLLDRRSVQVEWALPDPLPEVPARARQLEIVFMNLIKNAAEAMADCPAEAPRQLRIDGEVGEGKLWIRVSDTGPGISAQDLQKVFHSDYTTKGVFGTGIGLYLSRQIVENHGGSLQVASDPGRGTTFTVQLPLKS